METVAKSDLEVRVISLVESVLNPHHFQVVDLDCRIGGRGLVRIFIEKVEPAPDAVASGVTGRPVVRPPTIDECAMMSRLLSEAFDLNDAIPGAYDLEVSSPGLDRRLRLMRDFDSQVGREVKVKLWEKLENGGANFSGHLERTEPGKIFIKVGKDSVPIPISKVKQANLVWKPEA